MDLYQAVLLGFPQYALSKDPFNEPGKKGKDIDPQHGQDMVGAARFERATSCSQSRRSTKLSYAP